MTRDYPVPKGLISRYDSVLVVIDVQEKLLPVVHDRERVVGNIVRLLQFARIIGLPVIYTEQENLGSTVDKVRKVIQVREPISKLAFDAFYCEGFTDQVRDLGRETLILTGVEAHVSIAQTALHAIPYFKVHVVSDAVSSRTAENLAVALERMNQAGVVATSTEMIMFELLQQAGTDEFKSVLPLIK
ncbi:isochorismatase family protein [Chloroflexota bacterium]